jgi:protein phosphatase 2C-like protein
VFFASATGKRNLEHGMAGQDASHCVVTGDVLVAVVCDGAGSVPEGRTGSQFIAHELAAQLAASLHAHPNASVEATIRDAIADVRARLAKLADARERELADFSCTLVGCVASPRGGSFFHIGDGFGIWQDGAAGCVMSQPENGEYADETYFVTDEDWNLHLRITPLPQAQPGCLVGLLSDGSAPFAVNRARSGFFAPFIDPVAAYLRKAAAPAGNEALRNLLESPRASDISADDKTLLLAFVV